MAIFKNPFKSIDSFTNSGFVSKSRGKEMQAKQADKLIDEPTMRKMIDDAKAKGVDPQEMIQIAMDRGYTIEKPRRIKEYVGGLVSKIPSASANLAGGIMKGLGTNQFAPVMKKKGIDTSNFLTRAGEKLQQGGEESESIIQSAMKVNPKSPYTKAGGYTTSLGLTAPLTPVGTLRYGSLGMKAAKGAIIGGAENVLFEQAQSGESDEGDVLLGAAIGAAIPVVGAAAGPAKKLLGKATAPIGRGIKGVADKLQLSGLLNPAKLSRLKERLILEGSEDLAKATDQDVAEWMIQRNIKGSKQQIIKQLDEIGTQSKNAVDTLLANSDEVYKTKEANNVLKALKEEYADSLSDKFVKRASKVDELLAKADDGFSMTELNEIKRMAWDDLNPFTSTGKVKISKEDLAGVISSLKKKIEDAAIEQGVAKGYDGNAIKLLNNQTSMAFGLKEAIERKASSDSVRELLQFLGGRSPGAIVGGSVGSQAGPFDNNTMDGKIGNILIGAFLGGLLGNTKVKTNLANAIRSIPKKQKSDIYEWMISGGAKKLAPKSRASLDSVIGIVQAKNIANKVDPNNFNVPKAVTQTTNNPAQVRGLPKMADNVVGKGDDLAKEARKYKSADEFVESVGVKDKYVKLVNETDARLPQKEGTLRDFLGADIPELEEVYNIPVYVGPMQKRGANTISSGGYSLKDKAIILNSKFGFNKEELTKTLYEEAAHALRDMKGRSFDLGDAYVYQKHELTAKSMEDFLTKKYLDKQNLRQIWETANK